MKIKKILMAIPKFEKKKKKTLFSIAHRRCTYVSRKTIQDELQKRKSYEHFHK